MGSLLPSSEYEVFEILLSIEKSFLIQGLRDWYDLVSVSCNIFMGGQRYPEQIIMYPVNTILESHILALWSTVPILGQGYGSVA